MKLSTDGTLIVENLSNISSVFNRKVSLFSFFFNLNVTNGQQVVGMIVKHF